MNNKITGLYYLDIQVGQPIKTPSKKQVAYYLTIDRKISGKHMVYLHCKLSTAAAPTKTENISILTKTLSKQIVIKVQFQHKRPRGKYVQ